MNPCTCGTPFRDYDNRCLRCKKQIEPNRAEKLPFHRLISEIKPCKCSVDNREQKGVRATSVAELILCNDCDLRVGGPEIEELEVKVAREQSLRKAEEAKALEERITKEVERITSEAKSGKDIYLYRSVYVSIDSQNVLGNSQTSIAPFNDVNVKQAGAQGWKVVEAIPRTLGEALQNYEGFGKAWEGAIGGSVIGAYVLMEYKVTSMNAESAEVLIRENVENYLQS
jgi:hypothetical protein